MSAFGFSVTSNAVAAFVGVEAKVDAAIGVGLEAGGLASVGIIRGRVSGRPGLRVITGDFRRSIAHVVTKTGGGWEMRVGTSRPDGARHEFGFYGPDALGRVYNYGGYPYLRPSVPEVEAAVTGTVRDAIERAF